MGVTKITLAHDPNDFEVGNRHNLDRIIIMNKDATMNENAIGYTGLDRFECRKKLVEDLKEKDLLIELIKKIRKVKLDNNIGKDYLIISNNKLILENKNLLSKMLKNENILTNYNGNYNKIDINFDNDIVSIYYDGSLTEEEKQLLIKEKERLINSIARRKNLLSNQGYINKAPKEIVENEKNNLMKDEKDLELIIEKLK